MGERKFALRIGGARVPVSITWETPAFTITSGGAPATEQHYGSLLFADENGEAADASRSTRITLPGSGHNGGSDLSPTDDRMFAGAGTIAIAWEMPLEKYQALNRSPYLLATDNSTTNRAFGLRYFPIGHFSDPTNQYWTFEMTGLTTDAGPWSCESSRSIPNSVRRVVPVIRSDDANLQLDILDLATGTWYRGTPVAKPSGWAGLGRITDPLTIGGIPQEAFPPDNSASLQSNAFARGAFADLLIADRELSDADVEAIFTDGEDAVTRVGAAQTRLYCPLASNGQPDLSCRSHRAAIDGDQLAVEGVVHPGPSMKRQGASYLSLGPQPYPLAIVSGDAGWLAQLTGKAAGVSGQAQYRYVERGGDIVTDWADCAHTLVGDDVTFDVPPLGAFHIQRLQVQLRFSDNPSLVAATHSDVHAAAHIAVWSQSEGVFATIQGRDASGFPSMLNPELADNAGTITLVDVDGNVIATDVLPGLLGDGTVGMINAIRAKTQAPLVIALHAISGTSRRDLMDDARTDRQWADEEAAHLFVANRAASGAVPMTAHIDVGWEADDPVLQFGRLVFPPWLDGAPLAGEAYTYGNIDHFIRDGSFTDAPYYVMTPNRATPANASASTTSDDRAEANQRDSQRNWGHVLDYELGVPTTMHSMQNESGGVLPSTAATHPQPDDIEGSYEMGFGLGDTVNLALNVGNYPGAVFYEAIGPGSASNKVIVQIGSPRRFPGENLSDPDVGYDSTGFAMPTNLTLKPKADAGDPRWAFEAKIDDAGAFDLANVTAAEFISATQCELTLSADYVSGETRIRCHPGSPGGYRDTAVNQQDWRDGQHRFIIDGDDFGVSGSNQDLVLGVNPAPVADPNPAYTPPPAPPSPPPPPPPAPTTELTQGSPEGYLVDPDPVPAGTVRIVAEIDIEFPTSVPNLVKLCTQQSTGCDLEVLSDGSLRATVEDGTSGTTIKTLQNAEVAPAGTIVAGTAHSTVFDVSHARQDATVTVDGGTPIVTAFTQSGNGVFQTGRQFSFLAGTNGASVVPAGTIIRKLIVTMYDSGGAVLRTKTVPMNAVTANADPWKRGGDFS